MPAVLTRRSLLGAAAVALAGAVGLRVAPPGAGGPALSAARRATYAALAEAVATGPSMRLGPGAGARAADEFAARYAGWPAASRRHADAVLDRGRAGFASAEALTLAAVTIGPDDDGRAPLSI